MTIFSGTEVPKIFLPTTDPTRILVPVETAYRRRVNHLDVLSHIPVRSPDECAVVCVTHTKSIPLIRIPVEENAGLNTLSQFMYNMVLARQTGKSYFHVWHAKGERTPTSEPKENTQLIGRIRKLKN